jgi:NO-binding membrane sensor protein with MHYT domain
MSRLPRDTLVATAVAILLIVAMAIDHLIGTESEGDDESTLADPGAFVLSVIVSLVLLVVLFVFVVHRTRTPEDAAKRGVVCSLLAIPTIALTFLGLPFPLSAAGIALGGRGRTGGRQVVATAAIALGSVIVVAITIGYVVALAT